MGSYFEVSTYHRPEQLRYHYKLQKKVIKEREDKKLFSEFTTYRGLNLSSLKSVEV